MIEELFSEVVAPDKQQRAMEKLFGEVVSLNEQRRTSATCPPYCESDCNYDCYHCDCDQECDCDEY